MKIIIIAIVIFVLLFNATDVSAARGRLCKDWTVEPGWTIHLHDYLYPDDGTPLGVAYSDYREDLKWFFKQFPHTCRFAPEPKPRGRR